MATKIQSKRKMPSKQISRTRGATHAGETAAALMQRIAERMERLPPETWEGTPTDGAKNVDHYLYGSPKQD